MLFALYVPRVIDSILLAYSFMVAGLFFPTLAALFWRRAGGVAAFWSVVLRGRHDRCDDRSRHSSAVGPGILRPCNIRDFSRSPDIIVPEHEGRFAMYSRCTSMRKRP